MRHYIQYLKEKKISKEEWLKKVGLEIEGAKAKIEGHEEASKQAVLQVETLGMMTKY